MKILCKSSTQVPGTGIVIKGQRVLWHDGVQFPPQVLANFVDAETGEKLSNPQPEGREGEDSGEDGDGAAGVGEPTAEQIAEERARAEKTAREELIRRTAELGRAKLESALEAAGVPHKAKMTCEELAKLLLRHNGEDVD